MIFGPFEKYVRPYRGRILLGALAIGIAQAAAARIPLLVGDAIDAIPTTDAGAGLNAIQSNVIHILENTHKRSKNVFRPKSVSTGYCI